MRCWRAGWRIGLPQADHVGSHAVGERFLRAAAARHGQHHGDNLVLGRLQVPSVEAEEDDHGQEGGALVAVAVGRIGHEAVLATILLREPPGLCIGKVQLSDGEETLGVLGEPALCEGMREITEYGGWRAYIAARGKAAS